MQKFRPFLKAIAPAFLTIVAVLVDWLILGKFEKQTLAIAITGLVSAAISYLVPNTPPTPPPTYPPVHPTVSGGAT